MVTKKEDVLDVLIIGGGISAHTSAIYTSRAALKSLILSGTGLDQLSLTSTVENFPGFPEGIKGPDLISNAKKQAEKFGARYLAENAISIKKNGKNFTIKTSEKTYKSKTVIISTGATARKLKIPGEEKYFGRGVSTCAVCDAALYKNKIAVVVGGGDSAMEEALALNKFAKKVYIVCRKEKFKASKIMQEKVLKLKNKIKIIFETTLTEVKGNGKFVTSVITKNLKKEKEKEIICDGMFLAIGHIPNTKFLKGFVKLDKLGYIKTNHAKTNIEGIYSAGDVQDHIYKQAITSAGAGCEAALNAQHYLENK